AVPMGDLWILLLWGILIATVYLVALWFWLRRQTQTGWEPFVLGSTGALLGLSYAFKGNGYAPRSALLGGTALIWGLLVARRYWLLKSSNDEAGDTLPRFVFFILRALVVVFASIPLAMLAIEPLQALTMYEWVGLI